MPPVRYFQEIASREVVDRDLYAAYRRKRFYQALALTVMGVGFVLCLVGLALQ